MKKILSIIVLAVMILALSNVLIFATTTQTTEKAELLKEMGLFKGTDAGFELDRKPTRVEALVMLIRLLGKESEALNTTATHPFKDIATWSDKYVAYAYSNGLTNGISKTEFGPNNIADSNMYLTFVLRALGYSDTNGTDFSWDNPNALATTVGILDSSVDLTNFYRGDIVLVSYNSLTSNIKSTTKTLYSKLEENKAITNEFLDINVTTGTKTLSTISSNEYPKGTSLKISGTPSDFIDKIEYYWDEDGITSKTVVSSYYKTITIQDNFEVDEDYILYIRALDINGTYTNWVKYTFEISESDEIDVTVKQGTTTLSTSKTYTYEVGTSLKITATPTDEIESIQYYWDEDGISSKITVNNTYKTITIPSDFEDGETYVLYVRTLDEDNKYTAWKKYSIKIGDEETEDNGITITVKQGTTTLSTSKTNIFKAGASLKITTTPTEDVDSFQYYWSEYGITNKTTINSTYKTIYIPSDFDEGDTYVLYIRVLDEDNKYTAWKKYNIKIGDEEDSDDDIAITVKNGTTTLSTTKTNEYKLGASLKIIASPSSSVESIQYYWTINGSSSKKTASSYTKTITIPDDFVLGDIYTLKIRVYDDDGNYTSWISYDIEISNENSTTDGEADITLTVKNVTTSTAVTLSTSKTYEYEVGTSLKMITSSNAKTSQIEYYWSDNGSNSKVIETEYSKTITIPDRFVKGEIYTLYVRAKDTNGDYTSWYEYKFEIPSESSVTVKVKQNGITLDAGKTYEYKKGTVLDIQATPSSLVSKLQYYWDSSSSNPTSVTANTKEIAVPSTIGAHTLYVRALDINKKYTEYAEYKIKVVVEVESINLNKTELTLAEGETETLIATVLPENATDKNVIWSSGDTSVATVDRTGKVTAISEGTAQIIATAENKKVDICTVTVTKAQQPATI